MLSRWGHKWGKTVEICLSLHQLRWVLKMGTTFTFVIPFFRTINFPFCNVRFKCLWFIICSVSSHLSLIFLSGRYIGIEHFHNFFQFCTLNHKKIASGNVGRTLVCLVSNWMARFRFNFYLSSNQLKGLFDHFVNRSVSQYKPRFRCIELSQRENLQIYK